MPRRYLMFFIFLIFTLQEGYGIPADSLIIIREIHITGNKVTQDKIIQKELTFQTGDTLSVVEAERQFTQSRENLLNTTLFNFVTIHTVKDEDRGHRVIISVIERWYIWPAPIFEHAERNLGAFIHDPDWKRINYGGQIFWYNFRGRREQLKLRIRLGYREQYELFYEKPNFGKFQKHGIAFSINQVRQKEVNIRTEYNKPVYLRKENYLAEVFNPYLIYTFRSSLYQKNSFIISGMFLNYRDSATHIEFAGIPYGRNSGYLFSEYVFETDHRDSKPYPLDGNYLRVNVKYRKSLSDSQRGKDWYSARITAGHHREILPRLYYHDVLQLFTSTQAYEPRFTRTGLGYGPYLRGYELYVADGNSYALLVNSLKYCIMPAHTYTLAYIPWSQFNPVHFSVYGNLFVDMAYVKGDPYISPGNTYVNRLLGTLGLGLDIVSYYDQVVRFEISLNREGQAGFFIHSEVPFKRW